MPIVPGLRRTAPDRRISAVVVALVVIGVVLTNLTPPSELLGAQHEPPSRSVVRHVVELMMENHGFDNFFGTFPGVLGLPPDVRLPDGHGGTVGPHWIPGNSTSDPPHDRVNEVSDLDGGRMDGFAETMASYDPGDPNASMGYYNGTQLGGYWALAKEYKLSDHYFAPVLGPTNPNRLYAVAGSSGGLTTNDWPIGGITLRTVFDQLSLGRIGWRDHYAPGEFLPIPLHLNPLSNASSERAAVVSWSALLGDIRAGTLPAVTFIDPSGSPEASEHPPDDITVGESWAVSVVKALESSPEWASTVLFLTWDEGGGYYDSVAPPAVDSLGDGFRVPLITISPWTTGGHVDTTVLDHTSILKYIEENWGLPYLNDRVAGAQSAGGLLGSASPPPA